MRNLKVQRNSLKEGVTKWRLGIKKAGAKSSYQAFSVLIGSMKARKGTRR